MCVPPENISLENQTRRGLISESARPFIQLQRGNLALQPQWPYLFIHPLLVLMAQDVELATRKLVTIEKGLEFLVRYLT